MVFWQGLGVFFSRTGAGAAWRRDSSSPAMPPKRVNAKVSCRSRDNDEEEAFIISEEHDSLISSNNDNNILDYDNDILGNFSDRDNLCGISFGSCK